MRQWHLLGLFVLAAGQSAGQGGLSLTASMPSPIKGIIGNTYGAVFGRAELVTIPLVARFTATGGTPPYTYTIQSGSLPSGLLLNPTAGVIQGVPNRSQRHWGRGAGAGRAGESCYLQLGAHPG